jgi:hypothetical protein
MKYESQEKVIMDGNIIVTLPDNNAFYVCTVIRSLVYSYKS